MLSPRALKVHFIRNEFIIEIESETWPAIDPKQNEIAFMYIYIIYIFLLLNLPSKLIHCVRVRVRAFSVDGLRAEWISEETKLDNTRARTYTQDISRTHNEKWFVVCQTKAREQFNSHWNESYLQTQPNNNFLSEVSFHRRLCMYLYILVCIEANHTYSNSLLRGRMKQRKKNNINALWRSSRQQQIWLWWRGCPSGWNARGSNTFPPNAVALSALLLFSITFLRLIL